MRFGLAVKKRRGELGLSQERLSELAGLHRTHVADIEHGIRNVSIVNVEKLAIALEVTISGLFAEYGIDG